MELNSVKIGFCYTNFLCRVVPVSTATIFQPNQVPHLVHGTHNYAGTEGGKEQQKIVRQNTEG